MKAIGKLLNFILFKEQQRITKIETTHFRAQMNTLSNSSSCAYTQSRPARFSCRFWLLLLLARPIVRLNNSNRLLQKLIFASQLEQCHLSSGSGSSSSTYTTFVPPRPFIEPSEALKKNECDEIDESSVVFFVKPLFVQFCCRDRRRRRRRRELSYFCFQPTIRKISLTPLPMLFVEDQCILKS